jgi:hypothetical protein
MNKSAKLKLQPKIKYKDEDGARRQKTNPATIQQMPTKIIGNSVTSCFKA